MGAESEWQWECYVDSIIHLCVGVFVVRFRYWFQDFRYALSLSAMQYSHYQSCGTVIIIHAEISKPKLQEVWRRPWYRFVVGQWFSAWGEFIPKWWMEKSQGWIELSVQFQPWLRQISNKIPLTEQNLKDFTPPALGAIHSKKAVWVWFGQSWVANELRQGVNGGTCKFRGMSRLHKIEGYFVTVKMIFYSTYVGPISSNSKWICRF